MPTITTAVDPDAEIRFEDRTLDVIAYVADPDGAVPYAVSWHPRGGVVWFERSPFPGRTPDTPGFGIGHSWQRKPYRLDSREEFEALAREWFAKLARRPRRPAALPFSPYA